MNPSDATPASFDFLSTAFLFPNVGAPFLVGLAVGYLAKKALKLALFFGGAAIVLLFVSEYYGVVQINDQALEHAAQATADAASQSGSFLYQRLSELQWKGGSAIAGFLAGLKLA